MLDELSTVEPQAAQTNISMNERRASAIAGGVLALLGLRRISPLAMVLITAGAALAMRASSGYCAVYDAMGIDTTRPGHPYD